MDFILMLISFFNLSVAPSDLSDSEIESLEKEYYETQHTNSKDSDGILEIVVVNGGG